MPNIPLILIIAAVTFIVACAVDDYYKGNLWIAPKNKK